jgi:hypothetical protein
VIIKAFLGDNKAIIYIPGIQKLQKKARIEGKKMMGINPSRVSPDSTSRDGFGYFFGHTEL